MSTKRLVKRIIQQSPYIEQIARKYKSEFDARNSTAWSFLPDHGLWSNTINSEDAEKLSGIKIKISHLERLGQVLVIGGKTVGGSDDIFKQTPREGHAELLNILKSSPEGTILIIYSPHPFWVNVYQTYTWVPSWDELYEIIDALPNWRILQYSTSFDPSGRYFFVSQKLPKKRFLCPVSELGRKTYHVFYFKEGADLSLSRSNYALSAHLCNALSRTGAKVIAHDYSDVGEIDRVNQGDVLIGHVGPWVKEAANRGIKDLILVNPANRWYPTRNSSLFESNATIEEQVSLVKLVIAQSGSIWRLTCDYPFPSKWRWVDLGADPNLFPYIKKGFRVAGKRRFLFIHLYDDRQKGADIAKEIIQLRLNDVFYWIGGTSIRQGKNLKVYPEISNTSGYFRKIVQQCDFVLSPSREDAQPGTYVETASLGLLPVASYTSGYSISYPNIVNPNTVDLWGAAIDFLQKVDNSDLYKAQGFFRHYLNTFHSWFTIENQILYYLREFLC